MNVTRSLGFVCERVRRRANFEILFSISPSNKTRIFNPAVRTHFVLFVELTKTRILNELSYLRTHYN